MKVFLTITLIVVLAAGGAAAWMWYGMTHPFQGFGPQGVFVTVPHGASSRTVARLLKADGVIRSSLAFELYARRHHRRTPQAGEYFFNQAMSGRDVFWKLAAGAIYEKPFTVREGETMYDIARELEAEHFLSAEEFLNAASDSSLIRDLAPQARTLEGFLFPATYLLPRHPAAKELTAEMVKKFREKWVSIEHSESVDSGDPPPTPRPAPSVFYSVTLASLVERETPKKDERPLVAGVFENRLHRHMLLQCDPTVIYALQQEGRYDGTLTGAELRLDSPYNTYEHTGLPPGPIANPGEASLRAALQPAHTNFLYFVANTEGGHFFSATLAEHNHNVTKYRRLLAGLPAEPPPPPPPHRKKAHRRRASHRGKG